MGSFLPNKNLFTELLLTEKEVLGIRRSVSTQRIFQSYSVWGSAEPPLRGRYNVEGVQRELRQFPLQ